MRVLYVRNLMVSTKEKELEELFDTVSDGGVEKVKILNDFAFIHFGSRLQAQQAMDALQGKNCGSLPIVYRLKEIAILCEIDQELNGTKMQITWAKPVGDKLKRCNVRSKLVTPSPRVFTSGMSPQIRYPAATVQQMWPHMTFSHPAAIQAHSLPLQTFPSYPLYHHQ